jgi:hypothetical protein
VIGPGAEAERDNALAREGDVEGDVDRRVRADQGDVRRSSGLVVTLAEGQRVVLPAEYAESSTSLGYALTVFRSQWITVEHAFGLAGAGLSQEVGYTQLSRGRLTNNLYVASSDNPRWDIGHYAEDRELRDQMAELVSSLSVEQYMARDNLPTWPAIDPDQLDAAYRRFNELSNELARKAPVDVLQELVEQYNLEWGAVKEGRKVDPEVHQETEFLASVQRRRREWIADHKEDILTWTRLDDALRRHEYRLGQAAAYSRPQHVTSLLGPVPTSITEAERWQTAGGAIEAYRTRWTITGERALGSEPTDPEQRAHWKEAVVAIVETGFFGSERSADIGSEHEHLAMHWRGVEAAERRNEREADEALHPIRQPSRSRDRDHSAGRDRDRGFGI